MCSVTSIMWNCNALIGLAWFSNITTPASHFFGKSHQQVVTDLGKDIGFLMENGTHLTKPFAIYSFGMAFSIIVI